MFFEVTEVFDHSNSRYSYNIYREDHLLHKSVCKNDVERFVLDRDSLHDSDLISYDWGWGCLGHITGLEAREILSKKDVVTINWNQITFGH